MRFKHFHIDGFGIFHDRTVGPFYPGLNVVYGENEFGKTTLLEFVRRILFGFPDRRHAGNPYPAVNGGSYGGRIAGVLGDGTAVVIERSGTVKGGKLSVHAGEERTGGEAELSSLLRLSARFYENVYGFTLDELTRLNSLDDEEIRNRIYGAGLELGRLSLSELKRHFSVPADAVYLENGRNRELQLLDREAKELKRELTVLRENLPRYRETSARLAQLMEESRQMAVAVEECNRQWLRSRRRRDWFNDGVELAAVGRRLEELAAVPDIPADALTDWEQRKQRGTMLAEREERCRVERERLRAELTALRIDPVWQERRGAIIALQKQSGGWQPARNEVERLTADLTGLRRELQAEAASLGTGFTPERIRTFSLPLAARAGGEAVVEELHAAQEQLRNAELRLEADLESRRGAASAQARGNLSLNRGLILVVLMLGLAGSGVGLWQSPYLTGFGLVLLVMGGAALIMNLWSGRLSPPAAVTESPYRDEVARRTKARDAAVTRWRQWLTQYGLPDDLRPESLAVALKTLERARLLTEKIADTEAVRNERNREAAAIMTAYEE
ncbi:MAG: AAA family ATPase, partial [Victivallales bacterium]|nr:AAA family ATPase [Victivallales bacterium]